MTVKERLEEIKSRVWIEKCTYAIGDYSQREGYIYTLSDYDYEWLIEQAGKVEELELEINDWRTEVQKWQKFYKESEESHSETKELLKSIVNQNKRYREALEKIMRTETVTTGLTDGKVAYTFSGHIARKALEGDDD